MHCYLNTSNLEVCYRSVEVLIFSSLLNMISLKSFGWKLSTKSQFEILLVQILSAIIDYVTSGWAFIPTVLVQFFHHFIRVTEIV